MRYVEVNGARVSAIGVGTWQFGSKEWGYGPEYARTTAAAIVNRALDLGVNLVDTAEIYGMGASERILGGLASVNSDRTVATVPKTLPIHLASGDMDPVGGKQAAGPRAVAEQFRRNGVQDVTLTVWPGARHEILNETNRDEVEVELVDWLDAHLPAKA